MIKKILFPHQGAFLQAPFVFPDRRYVMLVAGYGAGKTAAIAQSHEYKVKLLQGKKDKEGHNPRLILGGVTLGHIEKTTLAYIIQDYENSGTPYKHDTKNNILTVGNVETLITPLQNPGAIMGYDVWCLGSRSKVWCRTRLTKPVKKYIIDIEPGDMVLTRAGWKAVINKIPQGIKETVQFGGIRITEEHRILALSQWTKVSDVKNGDRLLSVHKECIVTWSETNDLLENIRGRLYSLREEISTVIQSHIGTTRETTMLTAEVKDCMSLFGRVQMGQFQKDMSFTIKTITRAITRLTILSCLQRVSMFGCIIKKQRYTGLLSYLKQNERVLTVVKTSLVKELQNYARYVERNEDLRTSEKEENTRRYKQQAARGAEERCTQSSNVFFVLSDALTQLDTRIKRNTTRYIVKNVYASYAEKSSEQKKVRKPRHARVTVKISKEDRRLENVWDLTVQDCHEFFTSACLVHNCADLDEVDDLGLAAGEDTTFEAVKSVNERVRQVIPGMRHPFITMGSTSQGQRGLYRLYTQFKKSGTGFVLIRGSTRDNWYLDKTYVKSLEDIYNERERRVFLDGEFLAISKGQVFGDFDWKRNYSEEEMDRHIASDETLYWGQDFNQGYHRGSISVVRGNRMYVVKRYEFLEIRDAPKIVRYDFPTQKIFFIPDTTAKEQVMHFMKELREHKIHWIIRGKNPLVEDSAFLVNKLLYTGRLIITRGARETAEAMSLFHRDKNGVIPKGIGPNDSAHDCDSVRLVAFFLACNRRAFADIAKLTIGRHDYIDEDKGALTELASGYCDLAPEILH